MDQIRLKISGMSENEKKCTILLDEVAIMKTLEYNKVLDEIEGYEDLGKLGRTNKIGFQALVVMVRGLYSNWKFPLCYFFTESGVKGDNLVNIIKDCVQQILDLGSLTSMHYLRSGRTKPLYVYSTRRKRRSTFDHNMW